jgi:acetyl-CoA carboxylase biotin carboxyl carrier protein
LTKDDVLAVLADSASPPDQDLVRLMWQEARDLLKRLEGSSVRRMSVQAGQYKVEIELGGTVIETVAGAPRAATGGAAAASAGAAALDSRLPILAPLVGTFFRSPQPGAKAFVEVGDVVEPGQTVGIVEAMKIMNQVASEHRGRVVEIATNDGEWVEFQQPLIYLEPLEAGSSESA